MSNKTIAKFFFFVILTASFWLAGSACSLARSDGPPSGVTSPYELPRVTGKIRSGEITESSGIAASRCNSNVFWTHNDSGDEAFIYAFNATGDHLGAWRVPNASNRDWEDLASSKDISGRCYLYIGEIGDNKLLWPEHMIYRVEEPLVLPDARSSSRNAPMYTAPAEVLRYSYPDGDHDAEALMVHPLSGDIYVLSKQVSGPAGVYHLKPIFQDTSRQTAVKVADLSVPAVPNGLLTGGDISPDGSRVVVCDYGRAYELVLPLGERNFDAIWKQDPVTIETGKRKAGEAICYNVDGTSLFATSEGRNSPVLEIRRTK
jgi:hypothetical protein